MFSVGFGGNSGSFEASKGGFQGLQVAPRAVKACLEPDIDLRSHSLLALPLSARNRLYRARKVDVLRPFKRS